MEGMALAPGEVSSCSRRVVIWAAPVLGVLAAAAFVVVTPGNCDVIGAATKHGVLAAASFQVLSLRWFDVVRTASESGRQAAAFLVVAVGGGDAVLATSVVARRTFGLASQVVWPCG